MVKYLITCEHASNKIPTKFRKYFANAKLALASHRGWDIGAYQIYQQLIKKIPSVHFSGKYSRLLIELNRSLHSAQLFSNYTIHLPENLKQELITDYYEPYRNAVIQTISKAVKANQQVIHLSIHSFTPKLHGIVRETDIGLLYDPTRKAEQAYCIKLQRALRQVAPQYRIRRNYPYKGSADGLTTTCRKQFKKNYIGIEIEVNQKFANNPQTLTKIGDILSKIEINN